MICLFFVYSGTTIIVTSSSTRSDDRAAPNPSYSVSEQASLLQLPPRIHRLTLRWDAMDM